MTKKSYLETLLEEFEDDFEFKVDCKILDITEEICKAMDDKGLNRADLSRLLEISKPAVTRMLNGNTNFTLKRLLKIATALNKDLNISFTEPKKLSGFNNIEKSQSLAEQPMADNINSNFLQFNSQHPKEEKKMIPEPVAA